METSAPSITLARGQRTFRILVVDDLFSNRDVLLLMLTEMGFHPREAINGSEAVAIFEQWHPDVILMDVMMGQMDGGEATRRIKSSPGGEKTAVIIVAPDTIDVDDKWAAGIGADGFIRKPLRDVRLARVLQEAAGIRFVTVGERENGALAFRIKQEPAVDIPEASVVDMMKAVRERNLVRLMQLILQCAERDRNVENIVFELLKENRFGFGREFP